MVRRGAWWRWRGRRVRSDPHLLKVVGQLPSAEVPEPSDQTRLRLGGALGLQSRRLASMGGHSSGALMEPAAAGRCRVTPEFADWRAGAASRAAGDPRAPQRLRVEAADGPLTGGPVGGGPVSGGPVGGGPVGGAPVGPPPSPPPSPPISSRPVRLRVDAAISSHKEASWRPRPSDTPPNGERAAICGGGAGSSPSPPPASPPMSPAMPPTAWLPPPAPTSLGSAAAGSTLTGSILVGVGDPQSREVSLGAARGAARPNEPGDTVAPLGDSGSPLTRVSHSMLHSVTSGGGPAGAPLNSMLRSAPPGGLTCPPQTPEPSGCRDTRVSLWDALGECSEGLSPKRPSLQARVTHRLSRMTPSRLARSSHGCRTTAGLPPSPSSRPSLGQRVRRTSECSGEERMALLACSQLKFGRDGRIGFLCALPPPSPPST